MSTGRGPNSAGCPSNVLLCDMYVQQARAGHAPSSCLLACPSALRVDHPSPTSCPHQWPPHTTFARNGSSITSANEREALPGGVVQGHDARARQACRSAHNMAAAAPAALDDAAAGAAAAAAVAAPAAQPSISMGSPSTTVTARRTSNTRSRTTAALGGEAEGGAGRCFRRGEEGWAAGRPAGQVGSLKAGPPPLPQ